MEKTIIYQILPRLWGSGRLSALDGDFLDYLRWMGVSHVWYTGLLRHATGKCFVKGNPGSPYAVQDCRDINSYLADDPERRLEEFDALVERTHAAGLKFIMDFIPNHVSRDNVNFGQEDDPTVHWKAENDFYWYPGEALSLPGICAPFDYAENPARASGNCFSPAPGEHDWYETVKLNYCPFHTRTWDKMLDILSFWAARGVDGFRCDMVELVPREFLTWLIASLKKKWPRLEFIAEAYEKENYWPYVGKVGFDWLYDKSYFYDSLRAIVERNIRPDEHPRCARADELSHDWQCVGGLSDHLLHFLENHDEQRFASDFFGKKASNAYAPLAVSLLFCPGAFLLYAGEEAGERGMQQEGFSGLDGRTSIFDFCRVPALDELEALIHTGKYKNQSINEIAENSEFSIRQAELFCRYHELLALSREMDPALRPYDLGWCQRPKEGFDAARHFVFLRKMAESSDDASAETGTLSGSQPRVLLCAVNFGSAKSTLEVSIPKDAALYFGAALPDKVRLSVPGMDFSTWIL